METGKQRKIIIIIITLTIIIIIIIIEEGRGRVMMKTAVEKPAGAVGVGGGGGGGSTKPLARLGFPSNLRFKKMEILDLSLSLSLSCLSPFFFPSFSIFFLSAFFCLCRIAVAEKERKARRRTSDRT